uniref:Uncharacterized protein n=1 Tax=Anguilla anguilla TaxID=7936 RepID=A0A0E9R538_ANGAN
MATEHIVFPECADTFLCTLMHTLFVLHAELEPHSEVTKCCLISQG